MSTSRIGVAGLGTVGAGLLQFIAAHPGFVPGGAKVEVAGVSARSRSRPRPIDVSAYRWFDDPVALAGSPEVDLFVELVGGSDGPAKAAIEAALHAGKPVVTANKALIAEHGLELARLAERVGAPLVFEAAVMGGTPAVKMLREGLVGDQVVRVAGILNGTCNFILSEMERTERPFAEVLAEAQRLGFAEADPIMDVGGFDAGHKIAILAALAFGGAPNFAAAEVEGITGVELVDIRLARELGYRVKLVASAVREGEGASVRVHPALVPLAHPLAQAGGALNALFIEGERIGRIYLQGPGAGAGPTAAAVAADIADVISQVKRPVFQQKADALSPLPAADRRHHTGKVFLRLIVQDRPGVIARVSDALAQAGVSIDSFLQHSAEPSGLVPIVLTTHPVLESAVADAVERIASLDVVVERPKMIRIALI